MCVFSLTLSDLALEIKLLLYKLNTIFALRRLPQTLRTAFRSKPISTTSTTMGGSSSKDNITNINNHSKLLLHSIETIDNQPQPFVDLIQPNGAVIFLVRRMG